MMKSVSDNDDEKCLRSPLLLSSRNPQTMSACTLCNALLIMSLLAASPLAASWRRRRSMSAHDVSLQRPAHHVMLGFPLGRRCTRRNCLPSNDVCMHTTSLSATPCSSCHCCGLPMSLPFFRGFDTVGLGFPMWGSSWGGGHGLAEGKNGGRTNGGGGGFLSAVGCGGTTSPPL